MIVLHAAVPIDSGHLSEAIELAEYLVEESNREDGTINYRATTDILNENVIRFFEQYEDEAAHEAHTQTDHFPEFEERLPRLLSGEPEVTRFDVSQATELEV